jgi:hypothetical protein
MDVISSLLVAANDEEKTEVLQHPLIGERGIDVITPSTDFFTELYLTLKWSKVCYFFYLWIAAYVVFVLSLSVYVTLMAHNYVGIDGIMAASRWILIVSATCLLVHGILQVLPKSCRM